MKKMITSLALGVLPFFLSAQILVDEIHIACGNHFFNEINTHRQAAMLVRGIFCGDSYFWSPISAGDTIQEIAYRGEDLFTGVCIDLDTAGNVMGRYTFQNGLIQKLEEFYATGEVDLIIHYKDGIPNGPCINLFENGVLYSYVFFDNGIKSGAYYRLLDRTDYDLPPCVDYGQNLNGERFQLSPPCFDEE
jgi:hypothetical protein